MAGDVLLVTGGGRGIGASVVRRAAQAGIAVAFSYRSDEAAARAFVSEVESAGSRALAIRQDVGEADAIPGLFDAVENQLGPVSRSEEHTSELQSLMRISYAVFCLKQKKKD